MTAANWKFCKVNEFTLRKWFDVCFCFLISKVIRKKWSICPSLHRITKHCCWIHTGSGFRFVSPILRLASSASGAQFAPASYTEEKFLPPRCFLQVWLDNRLWITERNNHHQSRLIKFSRKRLRHRTPFVISISSYLSKDELDNTLGDLILPFRLTTLRCIIRMASNNK